MTVTRVTFPSTLVLYVCGDCGKTETYHPYKHRSRRTGGYCKGDNVWAQPYVPSGEPVLSSAVKLD